jgi:2,5-diketo-D-gluconate reductase A
VTTTFPAPTVTLNNGVRMAIIGFGVFEIPPEQTQQVVEQALAAGYRHLDTAASYGDEEAVGAAIGACGMPRDELFVTTKLWIQARPGEDVIKPAFDTSLRKLGLDYLDLYLIHQPLGDYYRAWRKIQNLHRDGAIKAIGVSNFHGDRLVDLIERNEITPAVDQVENHPFHARFADQELMRNRGVQIGSWGPFAEGKNNLFTNPTLAAIGEAHGKSVGQIVLRWLTQRQVVVIRNPCDLSEWPRTSTSSAWTSPTSRWRRSHRSTPGNPCSSTIATRRWSPGSTAAPRPDKPSPLISG